MYDHLDTLREIDCMDVCDVGALLTDNDSRYSTSYLTAQAYPDVSLIRRQPGQPNQANWYRYRYKSAVVPAR